MASPETFHWFCLGRAGIRSREMRLLTSPGKSSSRRVIVLKGYDGWAGHASKAVATLEMCAELLYNYDIFVYAASPTVLKGLSALRAHRSIRITALPRSPHSSILQLFGRARIALAVNVTDGIPNAMLEAMTMGAFPIQSDTQSTSEWITDGVNGLLVDPDNPESIAAAVRRAIEDDQLIDTAASHNVQLITERLDLAAVRPRVIDMYRTIAAQWEPHRQ